MHNLLHCGRVKSCAVLAPLAVVHRVKSNFTMVAALTRSRKKDGGNTDNVLKVLDLVPRKGDDKEDGLHHHRLINDCMHNILQGLAEQVVQKQKMEPVNFSNIPGQSLLESMDSNDFSRCSSSTRLIKEDACLLVVELRRSGLGANTSTLASAVSSCADRRALRRGTQLHALLVKVGYDSSIIAGTSLISLYSRCGQLENALQFFQSMAIQNTVSWTALISGYAQYSQVEPCFHLFASMRQSMCRPNDITFATLFSVCTSHAFLALGRSVHGLEMRMGFDSYVHVSNALISMYSKCGSIDKAQFIFENIGLKDLVSWNSMIFGYSQYGLAEDCLDLLKEMDRHCVVPDAISFLGVLSSCRHACLVEQGRRCFKAMLEHGIEPEIDHYSCMVDLLGRAGLLHEAWDLIQTMPTPPNAVIWGSLLSACRVHRNVWIGICAAEHHLKLEPGCSATHVQLANLYASVGYWGDVAGVRKLMKDRGLKTNTGCSWIEVGNELCTFKAENRSDDQMNDVLAVLDCLQSHMECKPVTLLDGSECDNAETILER